MRLHVNKLLRVHINDEGISCLGNIMSIMRQVKCCIYESSSKLTLKARPADFSKNGVMLFQE